MVMCSMSKRGKWIIPEQDLRERAHTAWLAVMGLEEIYRRGAIDVWWERCERVLKDEHPYLIRRWGKCQ